MTINQAPLNIKLIVRSFPSHEERALSDVESRLMHLGFMDGEVVMVTKKSPLFQGPMLVYVRGRLIALSRNEGQLVDVEIEK